MSESISMLKITIKRIVDIDFFAIENVSTFTLLSYGKDKTYFFHIFDQLSS